MTVYYHKHNQVITPITAAPPDAAILLEQITIFLGDTGPTQTGPLGIFEAFGSSVWSSFGSKPSTETLPVFSRLRTREGSTSGSDSCASRSRRPCRPTDLAVPDVSVAKREAARNFRHAPVGETERVPFRCGSREMPSSTGILLWLNSFWLATVPQWRPPSYHET